MMPEFYPNDKDVVRLALVKLGSHVEKLLDDYDSPPVTVRHGEVRLMHIGSENGRPECTVRMLSTGSGERYTITIIEDLDGKKVASNASFGSFGEPRIALDIVDDKSKAAAKVRPIDEDNLEIVRDMFSLASHCFEQSEKLAESSSPKHELAISIPGLWYE